MKDAPTKHIKPQSKLAALVVHGLPYDPTKDFSAQEIAFAKAMVKNMRRLEYPDARIEKLVWAWAKESSTERDYTHVTKGFGHQKPRGPNKPRVITMVLDLQPEMLDNGDISISKIRDIVQGVRPTVLHLRLGTVILHTLDLDWPLAQWPTVVRMKALAAV